jgi:hypothetical protein
MGIASYPVALRGILTNLNLLKTGSLKLVYKSENLLRVEAMGTRSII